MDEGSQRQRIDKWLFFARVVKSRSLAAKLVTGGHVRLNQVKIVQASQLVKTGDVLTIGLERRVLIYRIKAPGERRGPAGEARELYEDLTPERDEVSIAPGREKGAGRPTKKERRKLQQFILK